MKTGDNITIVSGSRLRRISEDGKRLLDQTMQEGAMIEYDTGAKVTGVVESKTDGKTAVLVELKHDGKTLVGWCFSYEIVPVERPTQKLR